MVVILVKLVSVDAIYATVFHTLSGSLITNRLTIIGWNSINIGILFWQIYRQFKDTREKWLESLQSVFNLAVIAYLV